MAKKPDSSNPSCPYCDYEHTVRNGHVQGRQRFRCRGCNRFFGVTTGTPMYRLHTPAAEVASSLLVVMRRGSLSAAEEITGHKYETLGRWLRAAAEHAEAITQVLVKELELTAVEIDAFWSFVKRSIVQLEARTPRRAGWALAGAV